MMWWDCVMAGLWPQCRNVTHRSQHHAAISWSLAAMTFGALDQCLGRELRPVIFHSLICCSGVWHQTTSNIFMLSLQVCCMLAATLATLCIVSICYLLPGLCGDWAGGVMYQASLLQYCTVITRLSQSTPATDCYCGWGTVALLSSE